jgi:hypothetical protein
MNKSRLAGHVACMLEMRSANRNVVGSLRGRDHSKDLCIDGRIILKWILVHYDGGCGLDSSGLEEGLYFMELVIGLYCIFTPATTVSVAII